MRRFKWIKLKSGCTKGYKSKINLTLFFKRQGYKFEVPIAYKSGVINENHKKTNSDRIRKKRQRQTNIEEKNWISFISLAHMFN